MTIHRQAHSLHTNIRSRQTKLWHSWVHFCLGVCVCVEIANTPLAHFRYQIGRTKLEYIIAATMDLIQIHWHADLLSVFRPSILSIFCMYRARRKMDGNVLPHTHTHYMWCVCVCNCVSGMLYMLYVRHARLWGERGIYRVSHKTICILYMAFFFFFHLQHIRRNIVAVIYAIEYRHTIS